MCSSSKGIGGRLRLATRDRGVAEGSIGEPSRRQGVLRAKKATPMATGTWSIEILFKLGLD
jgi:hypothetical protein